MDEDRETARLFHEHHTTPTVDIVICIHDALAHLKACLASVIKHTTGRYRIICINDGSTEPVSEYLQGVMLNCPQCSVIENETAHGYTKSANQGMRASTADYVILLNSDTIVTPHWLDKILECGESDPRIGIVGPLSNCASFQSVPEQKNAEGDWSDNPLPPDLSVDQMAALVEQIADKRFPHVCFINGFCYVIKRTVLKTIGYFDDESFPMGYGEEDDYSFRVRAAGFDLAVADHAYVYHAKSKSFGDATRLAFSQNGGAILQTKHGLDHFRRSVIAMESEPVFLEMGRRLKQLLTSGEYRKSIEAIAAPSSETEKTVFYECAFGGGRNMCNSTASIGTAKYRSSRICPFY